MVFTVTSSTIDPAAAFTTLGSKKIKGCGCRGRPARELLRLLLQPGPLGRLLVRRPGPCGVSSAERACCTR
jgi:hypothetical protein